MAKQVKLLRSLSFIVVALAIALALPLSVIGEEVITLTTIMPRQDVTRTKEGAIGTTYKDLTDEDVDDNNLIVEGNVGIGTTAPNSGLEVHADNTYSALTAEQIGSGSIASFDRAGGWTVFRINNDGAVTVQAQTAVTDALTITDTDFTNAINIGGNRIIGTSSIWDGDGNVGIGVTNPNNTIQVAELINFYNTEQLTAVGYQAGNANTSGTANTFIGYRAGYSTTSGDYNTALGMSSLLSNTTGYRNTAIGYSALQDNISGNSNAAIGNNALLRNTEGLNNVAVGMSSLQSNTDGHDNTAVGFRALYSNTVGDYNTAVGTEAIRSTTNVNYSTAVGYQALYNSRAANNTAMGYRALYSATTGMSNVAIGYSALSSKTAGSSNVAIGENALSRNTLGHGNIALGNGTGYNNTGGSYNVFLGHQAGFAETGSNKLYIDNSGTSSPLIKGDFSANTVRINGSFSKQAGSFDITHPDPQKEKQGWHLRHSFVESPTRGDNLYRWAIELENGQGIIELPDYFRHLNENVQVWVSPKGHFGRAYGEADTELAKIIIKADNDGLYNVLAVGTRKDRYARDAFDELGVEYQDRDSEHF